ncbi:MAG: glycosyltransferase family 4 protein [Erythrobacter sp.]
MKPIGLLFMLSQDKVASAHTSELTKGERMHVLMTVNAAWNIWNFRKPIVEALLADQHRVTVLAPPDETSAQLAAIGCDVHPLAMSAKGLNPIEGPRLQRQFTHAFRILRPDIALSFTIKNNIFGARAAQSVGVPFLPNVTGLGTAFLSGKLLEQVSVQLYRNAFGRLPRVFFQNSDDRDLFIERSIVSPDQARLLPGSGIDLDHFKPAAMPDPGAPSVFLMIARLLRDKGVLEFVEAARIIKSQRPDARFQLLGALGAQNRTAIDEARLDGWVKEGIIEYLGTTHDVRPAIAAASCVVLPSYREGAPRTLIEAAAMARPVITTDVPGCRVVLDRDVSGFLCEVRSARSLAEAIARFLALDPSQREEMGQAGRAKMAREFDQALVVNAYREAIALLNRHDAD